MRFPIYSLKTGILTSLTLLILLAMLLIHVVMMKFAERDLAESRLQMGRLLVAAIGEWTAYRMTADGRSLPDVAEDESYKAIIFRLLQSSPSNGLLMVNPDNTVVFETSMGRTQGHEVKSGLEKVLISGKWSLDFSGRTWGVIWFGPETMQVSGPIVLEEKRAGAVTVFIPLGPMYEELRRSEKAILIYIGLNTLILVFFGLYLLSRTVVKPIYKLLRVTEKFEGDGDFFLEERSSKNEIGQLYSSLNGMLKRLEENKQKLHTTISSLEAANLKIKQAQDEIIRSEKLASVGRLATGIAHEIGNPIGIILGYVELLKGGDLKEAEQADFLNRVESEVTRINRILRELLDFARPSGGEHDPIRLHGLIQETLDMLRPQPLLEDLDIHLELRAAQDRVRADADKLKQVILNIVMNAADALAEGDPISDGPLLKRLTVMTENRANVIVLAVSDTGTGIPSTDMNAIFDPFFTTKAPGKGTGLGLSVCYTIIQALGGTMEVESNEGEGTTVWITIPLTGAEDQSKASRGK
ncbi:MAG: ATP-binding protein [Thermodesulfobacteriota bacterium]